MIAVKQYSEKDFVEVFEGEESRGLVPKSWVGTDLLADGVKPKGRGGRQSGGQSQTDAEQKAAAEKAKADADAKAKAEAERKAAEEAKAKTENDGNKGS